MKTKAIILGLALGAAVMAGPAAHAAGKAEPAINIDFSFEGPFGKFDRAQLQRGFQVYKEVCAACHAMNYVPYRALGEEDGPGFTEEEVRAIAAQYEVQDGPDSSGEMFMRPALPSDRFVSPFPNKEAATAANGAYPPDLSLITKARAGFHGTIKQFFEGIGGPEYVYSVLVGYQEPPADAGEGPAGASYNPYFAAGPWIAMAPPLMEGLVEYADGTPATEDQMARDVAAFLAWAAEPTMVERKETGLRVILFLIVLAGLLYASYKKLWKDIAH